MALLEKVERSENDEPVWFMQTQYWLRVLVICFTVISIVTLLGIDTPDSLSGVIKTTNARYYYSSAFKFLLGVDVAVCALYTISLHVPIYYAACKKDLSRKHWYYLFLHDLIAMTVLISACGAAASIVYVGVYGQPETFWNEICNNAGDLCIYLGVSVAFSYVAVLCLFALTVISSYGLMKPSLTKEQDRAGVDCV
ncbi:CASP-like protein 1F2 [Silene latifolia]|uniref:CASP-like protein 1F2 n=1 Tax=Silene latifolia TaxID=37657 RepID=UPI003D779054